MRDFAELDRDRNRPFAWNLELTRFVGRRFAWSLRLEGSSELEDEPEWQLDPSFTWRLTDDSTLTLEALHGRYRKGLAGDEAAPLRYRNQLAAQVSIAF